jgi:hypothetical protein
LDGRASVSSLFACLFLANAKTFATKINILRLKLHEAEYGCKGISTNQKKVAEKIALMLYIWYNQKKTRRIQLPPIQ